MIGSVPISQKLLNDGERVIVSTRTHPKALVLPVLALVLLVALGTFLDTRLEGDGAQGVLAWIVWGLVAIGVLWFSVWPFLTWLTAAYAFTDRRLITRTGVLTRRGATRVHRLAWTVADLAGVAQPGPAELDTALRLRTGRPLELRALHRHQEVVVPLTAVPATVDEEAAG